MKSKAMMAALALVILVAGIGGTVYRMAFAPNTPAFEGKRSVWIPRGAGFEAAVDSLEAGGVLGSRPSFVWLAKLTGWGDQIKAGHYAFEAGATNRDLLETLRKGLQTPVRLTIPPGTRPEVVAAVVAREMAFSPEDFLAALHDSTLAADLGTDTTHLFGYMMPETYFFYWLTDAPTVVRKVKQAFDTFYRAEVSAAPDPPDLSPDDVVTLASIVEWETHDAAEKPRVAGVYLNRLRAGWALQADPTVQYAILAAEGHKRRLLFRDYEVDHPYNTYRYRGLPPGPVTNPAPSTVRAVLRAEKHRYFYFVANGDGTHTFSRTLREHNRAADTYRRLMRRRRRAQRQSD
ncbi:endolytic transglycosylase MltG [Rhodocaloribacter sp.]